MDRWRAIELPKAYALALWLRELDLDEGEIAEALGMEFEAIRPLLHIARLKIDRLEPGASRLRPGGVVVFLDGTSQGVIDAAAELALERAVPLHLVASRGRRAVEIRLLVQAIKALRFRIDVIPHDIGGALGPFVEAVTRTWGPVTVVVDSHGALANSCDVLASVADVDLAVLDGRAVGVDGLWPLPRACA